MVSAVIGEAARSKAWAWMRHRTGSSWSQMRCTSVGTSCSFQNMHKHTIFTFKVSHPSALKAFFLAVPIYLYTIHFIKKKTPVYKVHTHIHKHKHTHTHTHTHTHLLLAMPIYVYTIQYLSYAISKAFSNDKYCLLIKRGSAGLVCPPSILRCPRNKHRTHFSAYIHIIYIYI
jgi:hypothetical protein